MGKFYTFFYYTCECYALKLFRLGNFPEVVAFCPLAEVTVANVKEPVPH